MEDGNHTTTTITPYTECRIVLATKHEKSRALSAPFKNVLGAYVEECVVDTDTLGTFSGEQPRKANALKTARKKCLMGLKHTETEYALASEGSFGPHPTLPFIPAATELLYFIDKKNRFELHLSQIFTETNFAGSEISTLDELKDFSEKALFPSHALLIRPPQHYSKAPIFKGIHTTADLEAAFHEARRHSSGTVWVETDMRAHCNPTRMKNIASLGERLAERLRRQCPVCDTPGWGEVDVTVGLPCEWCGMPSEGVKEEIYGCTKCRHRESVLPRHGQTSVSPEYCSYCNP